MATRSRAKRGSEMSMGEWVERMALFTERNPDAARELRDALPEFLVADPDRSSFPSK